MIPCVHLRAAGARDPISVCPARTTAEEEHVYHTATSCLGQYRTLNLHHTSLVYCGQKIFVLFSICIFIVTVKKCMTFGLITISDDYIEYFPECLWNKRLSALE